MPQANIKPLVKAKPKHGGNFLVRLFRNARAANLRFWRQELVAARADKELVIKRGPMRSMIDYPTLTPEARIFRSSRVLSKERNKIRARLKAKLR